MKEILIFVFILLIVFVFVIAIFNGRFIYAQLKYSFIGMPPAFSDIKQKSSLLFLKDKEEIVPNRLVIPSLGIEAPIIFSPSINEAVLQKALEGGVVYYPGSSFLGENGTMVILGHSSAYPWYKGQYGSIFALLNKLNPGDEIIVFSKDKVFNYRVEGKEIMAPKDLVFSKEKDKAVLYLVSCWPINTAWKRIVVRTTQTIDKN